MTDKTEAALRRKAAKRANAKLGFRGHLAIYLVINAGLVAINLWSSPDLLWFMWPMGGWAIGLLAHGLAVYAGGDVRDDMVEVELQRLKARQP